LLLVARVDGLERRLDIRTIDRKLVLSGAWFATLPATSFWSSRSLAVVNGNLLTLTHQLNG